MTFEYVRILNMPGIEKVLNMCERAFETAFEMPETEPKITLQVITFVVA